MCNSLKQLLVETIIVQRSNQPIGCLCLCLPCLWLLLLRLLCTRFSSKSTSSWELKSNGFELSFKSCNKNRNKKEVGVGNLLCGERTTRGRRLGHMERWCRNWRRTGLEEEFSRCCYCCSGGGWCLWVSGATAKCLRILFQNCEAGNSLVPHASPPSPPPILPEIFCNKKAERLLRWRCLVGGLCRKRVQRKSPKQTPVFFFFWQN